MVGQPIEPLYVWHEIEDEILFNGRPLFCKECYGPLDGPPGDVYFWDDDLDGKFGCPQRNLKICSNPLHGTAVV